MVYAQDLKQAAQAFKHNQAFFKKVKRLKPKDLDLKFHALHESTFQEIDCLKCANCCKTTSPIFLQSDIERLAKSLKMKTAQFTDTYLTVDEDGDFVLQSTPCPFLGADNKCIVYAHRPKACKEYPHTNRKRMHQITSLTLQNSLICPAVARIVHLLNEQY